MTPSSQKFLDAVELTRVPDASGRDIFTAVPQQAPWPKAYGGDLVAQAAASACETASADRTLNSMHGYFLRPATIGATVRYEVERLRDGRSYSTRQVRASQDEKLIFTALVSFQVPEPGDDLAESMPLDIPAPESLPSAADSLVGIESAAAEYWSNGRSFDLRHVPGPVYLSVEGERLAHQAVWVKSFEPLPDDPRLHQIALAYVCDYTILEPILRQQGRAWGDPGLVTASLDHSLWFHRAGRMDDWVLYAQSAVSSQHSRGLARGTFFSRDGVLLASVAQEGMIRQSAL